MESKAAAADSLEEEKEKAEREETDEKVGEGGVNTRNSSIVKTKIFLDTSAQCFLHHVTDGGVWGVVAGRR